MGLPAGTAGLKRHRSIAMEFASRTISPVPDISRYGAGLTGMGCLPPSESLPPSPLSLPFFRSLFHARERPMPAPSPPNRPARRLPAPRHLSAAAGHRPHSAQPSRPMRTAFPGGLSARSRQTMVADRRPGCWPAQ